MARTFCLRFHVAATALGAFIVLPPAPLTAQADGRSLAVRIAASADHISIYRGDATVGPVSTRGWSASAGVRSSLGVGGELFWIASPLSEDPYERAPRIQVAGGWATFGFDRTPRTGLDVFLGAGAAYFGIRGWPDFSGCRPPGCFREGGPSFSNGSTAVLIVGGGASWTRAPIVLRTDLRFVPANRRAGQSTFVIGLGIGVVLHELR